MEGGGKRFVWSFMRTHPTPLIAISRTNFPLWNFMRPHFFVKTPKLRKIFRNSNDLKKLNVNGFKMASSCQFLQIFNPIRLCGVNIAIFHRKKFEKNLINFQTQIQQFNKFLFIDFSKKIFFQIFFAFITYNVMFYGLKFSGHEELMFFAKTQDFGSNESFGNYAYDRVVHWKTNLFFTFSCKLNSL